MSDLSKLLRYLVVSRNLDGCEKDILNSADLIDQQAAEIERLKEELQERIDQILHMSDTIDMREEQRDEWRRRAAVLRLHVPEQIWTLFVREFPEAAQWFSDQVNSND